MTCEDLGRDGMIASLPGVTTCPALIGGEFRKHIRNIAWETEVWIMEMPDHMIHYNGDRFIVPREAGSAGQTR